MALIVIVMTQYFNHRLFVLLLAACQSRLHIQFSPRVCSLELLSQRPTTKSAIMRYASTWPASNPRPRHPCPNPHCLVPKSWSPTSHELGQLTLPGAHPLLVPCALITCPSSPTFESLLLSNTCTSCTVRRVCPSARPMVNERSTNPYSCRPILIWIPLLPQPHTVGGSDKERSSWSTSTVPPNPHPHHPHPKFLMPNTSFHPPLSSSPSRVSSATRHSTQTQTQLRVVERTIEYHRSVHFSVFASTPRRRR